MQVQNPFPPIGWKCAIKLCRRRHLLPLLIAVDTLLAANAITTPRDGCKTLSSDSPLTPFTSAIGPLLYALQGKPDSSEEAGFAIENSSIQLAVNRILRFVRCIGASFNCNPFAAPEGFLDVSLDSSQSSLKFGRIGIGHIPQDENRKRRESLIVLTAITNRQPFAPSLPVHSLPGNLGILSHAPETHCFRLIRAERHPSLVESRCQRDYPPPSKLLRAECLNARWTTERPVRLSSVPMAADGPASWFS